MKTLITALGLCLLIAGGAGEASAQALPFALSPNPKPGNLAQSYSLDFAVPDAPAFQLVHVHPSQILRPSSVRTFAFSASNLTHLTRGVSIPQTSALELSPGLVIRRPEAVAVEIPGKPLVVSAARLGGFETAAGRGVGGRPRRTHQPHR